MAVFYEIKERRLIPNWRDFKRTMQLGELSTSNKIQLPIQININRSIEDWKLQKNIGTAADLINSAFVSGNAIVPEIDEAISFILSDKSKSSNTLIDLIDEINKKNVVEEVLLNKSILEIDVDSINEFQALINNETFHRVINKTKNRAKVELHNPIIWVELARLYSMKGQQKKAENAIQIALYLAPNNRFVLRSATRFFIHTEEFEKAIYYLRNSNSIKKDPWLISAHIASSSIIGRFSPFISEGKNLIKSNNYSDFELTELASSIGTLEFKDGSFKKAKSFFEKSLSSPNDNSLAQLEWISKYDNRFQINPFLYENVINPFEAYAFELFERGDWEGAFSNAIKWFLDMPFSKRPAILGSYIAGSLLKDEKAAIILCQVGLQANPFDPILLNNIIYYSIINSSNLELAEKYLDKLISINLSSLPDQSKIIIQATLGLVALKRNDYKNGINLYELAIKNATSLRNDYLKNLAIVNFARELIIQNLPEKNTYIDLVKNIKIDNIHKDLNFLRNEVLDIIKINQLK